MTEKPKISIIGAGISGLTVAHELIKKGFLVDIYEKDEEAGGMAKSKRTKNNVPTEHSWRGYGPFYYNFFDIAKQIPVSVSEGFNQYTKSEVQQHNKIDDLWTIFRNEVYDITDFVSSHPGGNIILNAGGKDVEDVWNSMGYSWHANNQLVLNVLSNRKIGTLVENFSEKKTVYDNLNKKRINFDLLNNENYKQVIPSITDLIYIIFFLSKYIFSDNRRKDFYKLKLEPILKKNLSKDGYHYFIDFLAGPGYGFDKNTISIGHYALFIEFHL